MAVKVAINGFGRIGRLAFRQMFGAEGYEVVAINDLTKPSMLADLLKYDTAQGGYCGKIGENLHTVSADDEANTITVDGKTLQIYAEKDAKDCPWGKLGVDVVLECTGFYTSKAKSQAHLDAGAKKVVISAPAGNDLKTIVYSVNEKTLTADDTIISAASCTTNCLAPMANALNKYAPIQSGIMSTIHAYTGDQMILDGPHRKGDLRRARAGAANIVPNSTGAAKAIGLVIPELNGKLIGSAQRVPVPTGSTTILTAVVKGADVHAKKLAQRGFKVYMPAGEIKLTTEAIVGAECVSSLQSYNFTKSFLGANGISLSGGITTPDRNEARVKSTVVLNSQTVYILADHSKFDQISAVTFAQLGRVKIITDKLQDKKYLTKANIKEVM